MQFALKLVRSMLVLVFALAVFGCGSGNSVPAVKSTPIGASGGQAQDSTGKATMVVPAGALAQTTNITITSASAGLPTNTQLVAGTAYVFGPSGTQFAQPVTLSINYNPSNLPQGAIESNMGIFQALNGDWQLVTNSSVNTTTHTVSAPISHFSTYAVLAISPFSSTTSLSGTYSGGASGGFVMTINPQGTLAVQNNATNPLQFSGTGTVSLAGQASFTGTGSGSTSTGATFTFMGTFQNSNGQITASGTWNGSNKGKTNSGTWSIP